MNDKSLEQLTELLKKLGIGIDYGLPAVIHYITVEGWSEIIGWPILFIVSAFMLKILYKRSLNWQDDDSCAIGRTLATVTFCIVVFVGVMSIVTSVVQVMEPTGYLISKVLSRK